MNKILIILIAIIISGCGIRKSNLNIEKTKDKSSIEKDFVSKINETQLRDLQSKMSKSFDIYESDYRFIYTKHYDTSGRVQKETLEQSKSEFKDNTKETNESVLKEKLDKNNYYRIRERETITITHFTKQKNTERDNSLSGVFICIGTFIVAYLIFKPPK